MEPISVLIVDDSPSVRAVLRRFLSRSPGLRVLGEAADGIAALEAVERLQPDVLLLDLILPGLDGFGVLRRLAESGGVPTVILTSRADEVEVRQAFEALRSGALDLLPKPEDTASWHELAAILPEVLRAAAASGRRAERRPAARPTPTAAFVGGAVAPVPVVAPTAATVPLRWLALGASTGGPAALRDLLAAIPMPLPLRVLVVQHIAQGFEPGLADWMSTSLGIDVRVAVAGEIVLPGQVRLAPGGRHLHIGKDGRLELDATSPPRRGHRPSVDDLFLSLAEHEPAATIAALLSGMGNDGAAGLLALRRRGAVCVVQDEASSAVFGMARAALEMGAAERALSPSGLGGEIARHVAERR